MEEDATTTNPVEGIVIMEASTTESKTGVTLDAVTVEDPAVEATMAEEDVDIFNIESSPELGGTIIEEEILVAGIGEDNKLGDNPSIQFVELEIPMAHRRRIRSKE